MKSSNAFKWFRNQINIRRIIETKQIWWLIFLAPVLLSSSLQIGLLGYYSIQKDSTNTENFVDNNAEASDRPRTSNSQRSKHLPYFLFVAILELLTLVWLLFLMNELNLLRLEDKSKSSQKLLPGAKVETAPTVGTNVRLSSSDEPYQLLANMSHELRSPLNAILGFVQIVQQEGSTPRSSRDNLAIIHRSGESLLSIINDVIDLAKIETNRLTLEQNSVDFYSWLENIEQTIQLQSQNQGWEFNLVRGKNLPQYICIDERRLRQTIASLIDYCLKHTPTVETNRVSVKVNFSQDIVVTETVANLLESPPKRNICVEVENTNLTATAEELESLFDPQVSVKQEKRTAEGSSLSLPISHKIAQLMGGDIVVSNSHSPPQGINFRLQIPAEVIVAKNLPVKSVFKRVIGLESDQTEYRILVVDDSKTNRKIMVQLLEPIGFKVQEAVNGQEAVDLWMRWQPHMIWMDLRMPVMNGYEATELIKSYSKTPQCTPIIALSASTLEEDKSLFKAAGCDDFVDKPFSENIIFDKIAQHLGIRYIYESIDLSPSSNFKLTPDTLNAMPPGWINRLEQAAIVLDGDLLTQLLQEIPPEHINLQNALQKQIDNFDFDKILDLTSQSKSN